MADTNVKPNYVYILYRWAPRERYRQIEFISDSLDKAVEEARRIKEEDKTRRSDNYNNPKSIFYSPNNEWREEEDFYDYDDTSLSAFTLRLFYYADGYKSSSSHLWSNLTCWTIKRVPLNTNLYDIDIL